jgi:hypothetical protein
MHSGCASHLRFPFIFALKELMNLEITKKDTKKQYLDAAIRVLSRGFNTDTNCSIVLSLVGAALGYDGIPHYFKDKVLKSAKENGTKRTRDYWSGRVVDLV